MSSKSLAMAALLGGLLAVGGCSIRKQLPQSARFDINVTDLGCMDKAGNQLEDYFAGKDSPEDVDAVWKCAESALDEFTRKVVGAEPDSYSAQELSDFLARYFIHDMTLTPELVAQVGILKQVLVGGAADRLTLSEIQRLKGFFEVLRVQSQNLRPFMPITPQSAYSSWSGIGGLRWSDIDIGYLDRFSQALKSAATALGSSLNATGVTYRFDQLDALAKAFLGALPQDGNFDGTLHALSSIHQHLDFLRAAKNSFLIPGRDVLASGSDWAELLENAAGWGDLAVRAAWLMDSGRMSASQEQLDRGAGLLNLEKLFDRAQGLFLGAVKKHPAETLTFGELDQLIDSVPSSSLPVPAQDIKISLRPIVRRLIGGVDPEMDGRGAAGLTPGILSKLHDIFHNWYEGQRVLETLFRDVEQQEGDQDGADYLRSTLVTSPAASTLWRQVLEQSDPQWNQSSRLAASRLMKIIVALRPLFQGQDYEITFQKYDEGLRYSFHDLSTINWMQSLSRLLVRGYAEGPQDPATGTPERADVDNWNPGSGSLTGAGVTLEEFEHAFADFKPLGVDLKFFNPDSPNAAFDRFREGDVFTYTSDGNGYLDMNEAATLLAFAVSAKRKSDRIHKDIAARCHTQVLDAVYEKPLIDYSCYTNWFYGQVEDYWAKLDEMVGYYQTLDGTQRQTFQRLLETSGRQNGYQPGVAMSIDDTEDMVAALQYIEAIFSRYDVGDHGYLSPSEAAAAFPVFKGVLEEMGQKMNPPIDLDDSSAELVFTYMLAKGSVPSGSWDVVWWDIEKHLPVLGDFQADRLRILQIFAALSDSSSKAPGGVSPPPLATLSSAGTQ